MGGLGKSSKAQVVQPPAVTPPAPMPDTTSQSVVEAKRRATELAMRRAGRASTIMSDGAASSSSSDYTSKTLG